MLRRRSSTSAGNVGARVTAWAIRHVQLLHEPRNAVSQRLAGIPFADAPPVDAESLPPPADAVFRMADAVNPAGAFKITDMPCGTIG